METPSVPIPRPPSTPADTSPVAVSTLTSWSIGGSTWTQIPPPAAFALHAGPPRSVLGGPDGEAVAVASSEGLGATGLDAAGACPTLQADSGSAMPNVVPREADMRVIFPVERGVMGARGSLSCLGRTPLP